MAFEPKRYDAGKMQTMSTESSTTIAKWDCLEFAGGYVQRADSSTAEVRIIAMEDKTTAGGAHEEILVLYVDGAQIEADTAGNTGIADVGTYVDLTDHDTLNEAATSTNVFYITGTIGAAADKKVVGYFVMKNN